MNLRSLVCEPPFARTLDLLKDSELRYRPVRLLVAPYHNRQVAVLRPEDWTHWLHLSKPEAELLRPLPQGALDVETVRPPSDKANGTLL